MWGRRRPSSAGEVFYKDIGNYILQQTRPENPSATYNFTKYLGLTLSGMDLTDADYYAYANTPRLPRGVYRSGRKFLATVNLNF